MSRAAADETDGRDEQAVSDFVERFAAILLDAGIPRMAARVFVALMASDPGRMTAAELAEQLQASPAAISGAVRFLVQVDLAARTRDPGSRRDNYVLDDDVWFHVIDGRMSVMTRWGDQLQAGVAAVGRDTEAGARLSDMVEFFDFMHREMPDLMRRWQEHRAADRPAREQRRNGRPGN